MPRAITAKYRIFGNVFSQIRMNSMMSIDNSELQLRRFFMGASIIEPGFRLALIYTLPETHIALC